MIKETRYLPLAEPEANLDWILRAPKDLSRLEMIVRRPAVDERQALEVGVLDLSLGSVGDTCSMRQSSRTSDGSPHADMQLTLMNLRVIVLLAQVEERWTLSSLTLCPKYAT